MGICPFAFSIDRFSEEDWKKHIPAGKNPNHFKGTEAVSKHPNISQLRNSKLRFCLKESKQNSKQGCTRHYAYGVNPAETYVCPAWKSIVVQKQINLRGRTSSLWGWRSPGTGCLGRLWSLLLWRHSRSPPWARSCAACCRWPCFGRRVGLDDPQRSLPTPTILWFCGSVFVCVCERKGWDKMSRYFCEISLGNSEAFYLPKKN